MKGKLALEPHSTTPCLYYPNYALSESQMACSTTGCWLPCNTQQSHFAQSDGTGYPSTDQSRDLHSTPGIRNSTYRNGVTASTTNKNKRKPKMKAGTHGIVVHGSAAGVHGRTLVVAVEVLKVNARLLVLEAEESMYAVRMNRAGFDQLYSSARVEWQLREQLESTRVLLLLIRADRYNVSRRDAGATARSVNPPSVQVIFTSTSIMHGTGDQTPKQPSWCHPLCQFWKTSRLSERPLHTKGPRALQAWTGYQLCMRDTTPYGLHCACANHPEQCTLLECTCTDALASCNAYCMCSVPCARSTLMSS